MKKIAIIYYSKACYTEKIAKQIAIGIENNEAKPILYTTRNAIEKVNDLANVDAVVFGSPTYFGSVAAEFKEFMDSTMNIWQKRQWADKIAACFTTSSSLSGDKLNTLMQMAIFAFHHGMVFVGLDLKTNTKLASQSTEQLNRLGSWLGLMAQVNFNAKEDSESDKLTAQYFGQRIAEITNKFNNK